MSDELLDAIEDNAVAPAKAHDDAGGMEQHSLADQIAFHKYKQGQAAASDPRKALFRVQIVAGGST